MTEGNRQERTQDTKDNLREESKESSRHGDRVKGGAEEINPEGEGTTGGVKEKVQDECDEAQRY